MSRAVRVCVPVLCVVLLSMPLLAQSNPRETEHLVASAEQIGRLHNEMLDTVAASGLLEKGDQGAMVDLMAQVLSEKLGGKIDAREAADVAERSRDAEAIARELDDRQQQLYKTLQTQIETSPNAEVMIRRLRSFETALVRRADLTTDQKRPILVAAVVARYSASYWSEAARDPKNAWNRIINPKGDTDLPGLPKWVGADAAGALAAIEALAPLGLVCPPCYLGGVVVVAAAASIVVALL